MTDPLALGRSVVVGPGQPTPTPWHRCDRVRVDRVDATVADRLGEAWRQRRPLVIELVPGLGLDDPDEAPPDVVTGRQPWEWSVDLDLVGERLHHALWSNAVDGRGATARWPWAERAGALGARPVGRADDGTGPADVVLPDGSPAVCDGGPLDAALPERLGVAVVHRTSIEHGALTPLGSTRPADPGQVALSDEQRAAVTEPLAGARVIAPAGAGKTRVLTERVRVLLDQWGLPPAAVTVVAFNVRAADELRHRLADLPGARVRTLNALGLRLSGAATTIDQREVRRRLDTLVRLPRRAEADPVAPWIEALGRVRLGLADPAAVEAALPDVDGLATVATAYRAGLAADDVVDFDEQVVRAVERLLGDPAFRRRSQRHARVLLVDEFQDLTPAHLLLLRLLAGPAGTVFAVGDDDQTIYGYTGASPRWLVDLDRYFPGVACHALSVNHRCPPAVVEAAANLLTRNTLRVPKTIRAATASTQENDGPGLVVVPSSPSVARATTQVVDALLARGVRPHEIAVLARVNAALAPVQVMLRHRQVPVAAAVDDRFVHRAGVRAALAWSTVAASADGSLAGAVLRDAARHPRRAMSASLLDLVARQRSVDGLADLSRWLQAKGSDREADKVRQLHADVLAVRRAASAGTAAVLAVVRTRIGAGGLDTTADALDSWSHGAVSSHADDLAALAELAELQPDPGAFPGWLADQLRLGPDDQGVVLASVHAVKGREWPHVVLHHVSDGVLPHRLVDDVEEERRVLHVGLTRGQRSVTVVPGDPPSPLLAELAHPVPSAPDGSGRSAGQRRASGRGEPDEASGRRAGGATSRRDGTGEPDRSSRRPGPGRHTDGEGSDRSRRRPTVPPVEVVAADVGIDLCFGDRSHRVVAVGDDHVRTEVAGSAGARVPYGTVVEVDGRAVLLAHPAATEALVALRRWRSARATADHVPAFVVFDDKTLRRIAAVLPTTDAELLAIGGIGPTKLARYGADLRALIDEVRRSTRVGSPTPRRLGVTP